jgi:hypothetical protein
MAKDARRSRRSTWSRRTWPIGEPTTIIHAYSCFMRRCTQRSATSAVIGRTSLELPPYMRTISGWTPRARRAAASSERGGRNKTDLPRSFGSTGFGMLVSLLSRSVSADRRPSSMSQDLMTPWGGRCELCSEGPCRSSRHPPSTAGVDGVSARPLTPEPEIDGPQHGGDSAGFPPGLNQSPFQCGALSPNL